MCVEVRLQGYRWEQRFGVFVFFLSDENVKLIVVIAAQFCEPKNWRSFSRIAHFKWVSYMLFEL